MTWFTRDILECKRQRMKQGTIGDTHQLVRMAWLEAFLTFTGLLICGQSLAWLISLLAARAFS